MAFSLFCRKERTRNTTICSLFSSFVPLNVKASIVPLLEETTYQLWSFSSAGCRKDGSASFKVDISILAQL